MEKVFCLNCKYFRESSIYPDIPFIGLDSCLSNPKMVHNHQKEWLSYALPSDKNKMNNCKEFQQKRKRLFGLF